MKLQLQLCQRQVVIEMLREMNRDKYKALQLLADHLRTPSKELNEIQIKEATPAEDATAAVVPEVSGD